MNPDRELQRVCTQPSPATEVKGMKLTADEIQALKDLLEQWRCHAERCDMIQNRPMAEWQKKRDLVRVSALEKVLKFLAKAL